MGTFKFKLRIRMIWVVVELHIKEYVQGNTAITPFFTLSGTANAMADGSVLLATWRDFILSSFDIIMETTPKPQRYNNPAETYCEWSEFNPFQLIILFINLYCNLFLTNWMNVPSCFLKKNSIVLHWSWNNNEYSAVSC